MSMLNLESFRDTSLTSDPYEYLVLPGFVRADCLKRIDADFPKIEQGGSFPLASLSYGGAFAELSDELLGESVKAAFSDKFGVRPCWSSGNVNGSWAVSGEGWKGSHRQSIKADHGTDLSE